MSGGGEASGVTVIKSVVGTGVDWESAQEASMEDEAAWAGLEEVC